MRIVHVIEYYMPGLGYEENCLPLEQAKRGHHVCIVTSRRSPFPNDFVVSSDNSRTCKKPSAALASADGIEVYRLPSTPPVYGQLVLFGLRRILKRLGPDVVHSHGALTPTTIQCLMHSKSLPYSLFVDDHSHDLNLRADSGVKATYIATVSILYKVFGESVRGFLPVTPSASRVLIGRLGIFPDKIAPVELGADHRLFAPSTAYRREYRQSLRLSDNEIAIVCAGKLTRDKDLEVIVEAISILPSGSGQTKLILAGYIEPEYKNRILALAEKRGVRERVVFLPFLPREELCRLYNAADIGIWPGPHTITALEALATGLACILPSGEDAYRTIYENRAALGFSRHDAQSLAKAITRLAANPTDRTQTSTAARKLVEDRLSWETIGAQTLQIYERMSSRLVE